MGEGDSENSFGKTTTQPEVDPDRPRTQKSSSPTRGWRFYTIITSLCVSSCLVALEGTVVSTALPSISRDLGGGEAFLWVPNAYFLSATAFQPLYGQSANIFGRRWLMISALVFFILGSGISGGASSMGMLIAGRTIQGVGGGGCSMLIDLIISDMVPVRQRGAVMGYIFGAATVCTALGPFIGGVFVQEATWRWVFYLNLPIAGVALLLVVLFLHMEYKRPASWNSALARVDVVGNGIFVAATVAILSALTYAGTEYSWSSWRIILPLVLGFVGLGLFFVYEQTPWCIEPTMPSKLFADRTAAAAFFLTFLHMLLLYWEVYFLPLYFQAVKKSSPTRSGVQLLPTVINLMVFAGVGGGVMEKYGRYREIHAIAFALMAIGFGLYILLDASSSTAEWVIFQLIFGAGAGLPIGVLLPVAQGALHEELTAVATGTWAVLRSFGTLWGITIATVAFNSRFSDYDRNIANSTVREKLSHGRAYEYGTRAFINSLADDPALQNQVIRAYSDSIRLTWEVATGLAGLAFLVVFAQRRIQLRTELDTEFGMVRSPANTDEVQNESEKGEVAEASA
ncbi:hypothetical protein M409DRAFT_55755 [Zasmidium cellare ATCC 36951]|uniref:Major facilitator superfamily (MFS) profile domain-containing protein n=1 Tax=Zasmidium cellare ATCC 36951 TaxID=1080233 RepID=A0A6A6CE34_ZASCE|nr:uncharacterized protein M409DRAFT_55755 [Zasmidium cellare ATCC 36951]KAF2165341.1 hypothetical protein M409DRAFT_55755 [Zasmidium cellare ATCC 36951]